MPTIIREPKIEQSKKIIEKTINKFNIKGIVISNLSQLKLLPQSNKTLDIVGNYTLNLYNAFSSKSLKKLNFGTVTISPELDENGILDLCNILPFLKHFCKPFYILY